MGRTVNILMCIITIAYYSDFFNGTFDLGKSFLSHIDDDTLDLVSIRIFDCVHYKLLVEDC